MQRVQDKKEKDKEREDKQLRAIRARCDEALKYARDLDKATPQDEVMKREKYARDLAKAKAIDGMMKQRGCHVGHETRVRRERCRELELDKKRKEARVKDDIMEEIGCHGWYTKQARCDALRGEWEKDEGEKPGTGGFHDARRNTETNAKLRAAYAKNPNLRVAHDRLRDALARNPEGRSRSISKERKGCSRSKECKGRSRSRSKKNKRRSRS